MTMPTVHIFLRLPILFITFNLITALIPSALCDDDAQYTECRNTYDCGLLKNITYPFWAANSRPKHCGREGYELTCRDNQYPVFRIEEQDFLVLNISREDYTITIARVDLWDSPCPSRLVNTTLDYNRFSYAQAVRNLTLFYGCVPTNHSISNNFTCKIEGTQNDLAIYIDDSISRLAPGQNETFCPYNIRVPIMWTGVDRPPENYTVDVLERVLNQGFMVEYYADWKLCGPCMLSNGTCGSNITTDSFLCFCGGHPYEETCPSSGVIVSDHIDFSFFYNCDKEPIEYMHPYPIECASNASHHSFAIFHKELVEHMNYSFDSCQSPVNLPVHKAVGVDALLRMNYTEILKMGFLLNWTAQNCSNCEKSSGRCGFKNNEFVCFCSDRPRSQTCDHDNSWNWKRKIVIGVCTAAATVLIMCVVFFVYQRRNRKQYDPSSFVPRSIFSKQTSMDDMERGSTYLGVHLFTYRELEEATNYFDSAKELGDGGFGTVYHGNVRDGRAVAVKRLYENNCKRVEQFMNEIEILAHLRHQNLVLLYGCTSRHSRELLLVYEYIPNGTLAEHLHGERAKPGALPWLTRMNIAIETASALSYLHASDIIHRDVKTTNILLDNNFCVKVADFGLSRLFPTDVTHISTAPQGTPGYVDPEYNQCYQLTSKSDVYSFGVVMIELISSLPAVDITRHRHEINLSNMAINKIQNHALHELVDTCLGFESDYRIRKMIIAVAELAFRCLQSDKDMRPSMPDVLDELQRIQSKDFDKEKAEEIDISADDVVLLKSGPLPPSPDSLILN
ncbi:LEAF RUST 10 DISEASE-RESISTANCE LOCUS RECEPTOR-LIKE PROTEIN KINASE-like 1.2 isoform X2 [Prunus yedoensis var. nudiflora]|uniref:non-specific serine/threonine protein kinase n=1 Tax=Prunus yedoensis var. nudiflora TaxID=2094558 RepID=A0A314Y6K3_PRUYE|nr:LEAF RUST 10 DISEASE-RESISTANCE LOCUS RECEPTOR-LIKE PROTEIN KINASE-like 1.2 isoform X2 [Prunus yedoensis var. nudiflora]